MDDETSTPFLLPFSPNGIPGAEESSWELVNRAPLTVLGALVPSGGRYRLSAGRRVTGPGRESDGAELGRP